MKALILCSKRYYATYSDFIAPFIKEQVDALVDLGVECQILKVESKKHFAYLRAWFKLIYWIVKYRPDVVHAHYGLCGVVASMQPFVPVVVTYHGSDINSPKVRWLSKVATRLAKMNIFVSEKLQKIANVDSPSCVIPCGLATDFFVSKDRLSCRQQLNLDPETIYILFSKEFHNVVKNYPLAKAGVDLLKKNLGNDNIVLLELMGYTREQVCMLYSAVNSVIMTSYTEGSPQFIKEAMACGCPIVSVDVGDVKDVIGETRGCYIAERTPESVAAKLQEAIRVDRTDGRERVVERFDNHIIAQRILDIYNSVTQ